MGCAYGNHRRQTGVSRRKLSHLLQPRRRDQLHRKLFRRLFVVGLQSLSSVFKSGVAIKGFYRSIILILFWFVDNLSKGEVYNVCVLADTEFGQVTRDHALLHHTEYFALVNLAYSELCSTGVKFSCYIVVCPFVMDGNRVCINDDQYLSNGFGHFEALLDILCLVHVWQKLYILIQQDDALSWNCVGIGIWLSQCIVVVHCSCAACSRHDKVKI